MQIGIKCKSCNKNKGNVSYYGGLCKKCYESFGEESRWYDFENSIKFNIPQSWRIGQFIFNFLEWLGQKGYAPLAWSPRMGDPFHLSDDDFIKYWQEYLLMP